MARTHAFGQLGSAALKLHGMFSPDNPNGKRNMGRVTWGLIGASLLLLVLSWLFNFDPQTVVVVGGLPVHVSWYTPAMLVLFLVDGIYYFEIHHKSTTVPWKVAMAGIFMMLGAVASVFLHELAHAMTALSFGHPITEAGVSGLGAYVGWEGGFEGVHPLQIALIALAGPMANFAIGLACTMVVWILPERHTENSFQYLAYANVRLGKFNLFPLFILDGGKVVDSAVRLVIGNQHEMVHFGILLVAFVVSVRWYNRPGMKGRRLEDRLANL